jgi:DNA-binding NtrC family response regulator
MFFSYLRLAKGFSGAPAFSRDHPCRTPCVMENEPICTGLDLRLAYIIDDEAEIRQLVTTTLAQHGFKIEGFATAKTALAALERDHPAVIFLDVALSQSDAIDVLAGLGSQQYCGVVHLMSAGRPALIEAIQRLGIRHGVKLATPLHKPVDPAAIAQALADMLPLIAAPRPASAKV